MRRGKKGFMAGLALLGLGAMLFCSPAVAQLATSGSAAGEDNIAPSPIADLAVTPDLVAVNVTVSWSLAADDSDRQTAIGTDFTSGGTFISVNDVASYSISRQDGSADAVVVGTVTAGTMSYLDDAVITGVIYTYSVTAADASGNESTAVVGEPVSLGPPPVSDIDIETFVAVSLTLDGVLPADPGDLEQLRQDLIAVLAEIAGVDPSAIRLTLLASGSIIVEFEIVGDDGTQGADLLQTVADDPAVISTTAADLGVATEFGEVTAQSTFVGSDFDFGTVPADVPSTKSTAITNSSTDPEAILAVTAQVTGAGFSVDPANVTLAIGESATVTVTFDPAVVSGLNGTYTGELSLGTNDPNRQSTPIPLTAVIVDGTVYQQIAVSPDSVSFPQVVVDSTETSTLVISNVGDLELTGSAVLTGDPAFAADDVTFALASGETVEISIAFTPADSVDYTATLTITSNSFLGAQTIVPVTGTGVTTKTLLLPGDFDGDLTVGFSDFFLFADNFGLTSASPDFLPLFDLDESLDVGFSDFFLFADAFGTSLEDGIVVRP
jgi:hypothetical protein